MMSVPELIRWSFSKKPQNLFAITEHFGETQQDLFKLLEILELIESSRGSDFSLKLLVLVVMKLHLK